MTIPNKYEEAIRLFDMVMEVAHNEVEAHLRFDQLLTHLRENFSTPVYYTYNTFHTETLRAVHQILLGQVNIEDIRRIPPAIADDIYPIALTWLVISHHKICLDPMKLNEFTWFHNTYGAFILGSAKPE